MSPEQQSAIDRVRQAIAHVIGDDALASTQSSGRINVIHSSQIAQLQSAGAQLSASMPFSPTLLTPGIDPFNDFEGFLAAEKATLRKNIDAIGQIEHAGIVRHQDADVQSGKGLRWLMVLPDASSPGQWRTQAFDTGGFSGHMTFSSKDEAIQSAAQLGFGIRDDEALDRLQDTLKFQRGLLANNLIMQVNRNALTLAEGNKKLAEYDALQGALTSVASNGAQAFVTGDDKHMYLVADRIKPGDEQAVFLHEVTHRWGAKAMPANAWQGVMAQLKSWEASDTNSVEKIIHARASQRVKAAQTPTPAQDEELFAYAVEEAVGLGVKPSALALAESAEAWLDLVSHSLKQMLGASLGVPGAAASKGVNDFAAQDLVDMAYAMAQLDSPQRVQRIMGAMTPQEQGALSQVLQNIEKQGASRPLLQAIRPDSSHLGLYSELAFQLEKSQMKQAPAAQWKSFISGLSKKGVKPDEIEWSGIQDWLALQEGRVSKESLVSFVKSKGVQVAQTTLHAADAAGSGQAPAYGVAPAKFGAYKVPGGSHYREVLLTIPGRRDLQYTEDNVQPAQDDQHSNQPELFWYFKAPDNLFQIAKSKYAQQDDAKAYILREKQPSISLKKNYKSKHFSQNNIVAHLRLDDRLDAEGKKVLFVHEIQSDWGQDGKKNGFRQEFDKRVPLVTGERLSVKDLIEREGNAGQEWVDGRNEMRVDLGEPPLRMDTPLLSLMEDGMRVMLTDSPKNLQALINGRTSRWHAEVTHQRREHFNAQSGKIADAPFVSTTQGWLSLAIKRVITLAAEEGHDRVAFISGAQAASLYDIKKTIEQVHYEKLGEDAYEYTNYYVGKKEPETFTNQTLKQVESMMGKDIAKKMSAAQGDPGDEGLRILQGENLSVGEQGMHTFYDTIVPNTLKDVLRRIGTGAVDRFTVPSERHNGYDRYEIGQSFHGTPAVVGIKPDGQSVVLMVNGDANENLAKLQAGREGAQQMGFDITPEMRAKVLEGLPMFSMTHRVDSNKFEAWSQALPVVKEGADDHEGGACVLVAYHGSTHGGITQFKRTGNAESYLGAGSYFTTSSLDASENYAGFGPDLSHRVILLSEDLTGQYEDDDNTAWQMLETLFLAKGLDIDIDDENFEALKEEYQDEVIEHEAHKRAKGDNDGVVYPVYVRLSNPADTTGRGPGLTYDCLQDEEHETLKKEGTLLDWCDAVREVGAKYNLDSFDYIDALMSVAENQDGVGMDEAFNLCLTHFNEGYDGDGEVMCGGAVFAEIAQAAGFDGVIMDANLHFGEGRPKSDVQYPMNHVRENTLHVMPFSSAQVKSMFNAGTFDIASNDIRFSIAQNESQAACIELSPVQACTNHAQRSFSYLQQLALASPGPASSGLKSRLGS